MPTYGIGSGWSMGWIKLIKGWPMVRVRHRGLPGSLIGPLSRRSSTLCWPAPASSPRTSSTGLPRFVVSNLRVRKKKSHLTWSIQLSSDFFLTFRKRSFSESFNNFRCGISRKFENLRDSGRFRTNCWNSGNNSSKLVIFRQQLQKISEMLKIKKNIRSWAKVCM